MSTANDADIELYSLAMKASPFDVNLPTIGEAWDGCQIVLTGFNFRAKELPPGFKGIVVPILPGPPYGGAGNSHANITQPTIWGYTVIVEATINHPDSAVEIQYTFDRDRNEAKIMIDASKARPGELQKLQPLIRTLQHGTMSGKKGPPTKDEYDLAWARIQAGEDPKRVRDDFLADYPKNDRKKRKWAAQRYRQAILRRRKSVT